MGHDSWLILVQVCRMVLNIEYISIESGWCHHRNKGTKVYLYLNWIVFECLEESWNGMLGCLMEWSFVHFHGTECRSVIEWNTWRCHGIECLKVSKNGTFRGLMQWNVGACHRLKCWYGMFACVMESNVRSSNLIKCWEMEWNGVCWMVLNIAAIRPRLSHPTGADIKWWHGPWLRSH